MRQYEKSVAGKFLPPGAILDLELEHEATVVTQEAGTPIAIQEDNCRSASQQSRFQEEILQSLASEPSTRSVIQQSHTSTSVHRESSHL